MKNKLLAFSLLTNLFLTPAYASGANCLQNIHLYVTAPDTIDMDSCEIKDADIPEFMAYLNQHPGITKLTMQYINSTPQFTIALAKNTTLKYLALAEIDAEKEAMLAFAKNTSLEALHLAGTGEITDEGLAAILTNKTLRELGVPVEASYSKENLLKLANSPTLTHIDLYAPIAKASLDSNVIEELSKNKRITTLWLGDFVLTDDEIIKIANMPALTDLSIAYNLIGPKALAAIANNKQLNNLAFIHDHLDADAMAILASNPNIQTLDITENWIGAAGLSYVASMPKLKHFIGSHANIDDQGALALSKSTSIETLELDDNHLGKDAGTYLSNMPKLVLLNINGNLILDEGAIALSKNPNITALYASVNHITALGAKALASMPNLKNLNLYFQSGSSSGGVGDEGAIALSKSTSLNHLNLRGNTLHNAAAFQLAKMSLEYLNVRDNYIDSSGLDTLRNSHTIQRLISDNEMMKSASPKKNWRYGKNIAI